MPTLTRCLGAALPTVLFAILFPLAALAENASPWATGLHSRVQLVAGGATSDSRTQLAGLVIRLDPGFKTYWRHPGESGLPPTFDWPRSANVAKVEVLWPAPTRFEDASGVSHGYAGGVVLPLRVTAVDAQQPPRLALKLHYGVCKDICIPAEAELSLALNKGPPTPSAIEQALSRVPSEQPLGAPGDLSVLSAEPTTVDGKAAVKVSVRVPKADKPQLFAEGPENWFLAPAAEMKTIAGDELMARGIFLVDMAERPRQATSPVDLRFTLVAGDRAVETVASLDTTRLPR
jgi:DsbC/DsbD-like thiol-disulfide interchange protein